MIGFTDTAAVSEKKTEVRVSGTYPSGVFYSGDSGCLDVPCHFLIFIPEIKTELLVSTVVIQMWTAT